MIHSSYYKPRIVCRDDVDSAQIDRAQTIDPTATLNRERVQEIGRTGNVGFIKRTPTIAYRLTQTEYGSMEFFRKITCKADSVKSVDLDDFKTPTFDLLAYKTDDDGTFKGTIWYPSLRTAGFAFNIGDPDAIVERTFDFVGEKLVDFQAGNKYFIEKDKTLAAPDIQSGNVTVISVSDPVPAQDPDTTKYMLDVIKISSGVVTELEEGTDYSYDNGLGELTVQDVATGDVIKYFYTAATYISGEDPWTDNDVDPAAITAESVVIELGVGTRAYRLQSATFDVRFDREDWKEIGNTDVVQRGIRTKTVTITLGRLLEDLDIEEVLRDAGADYGKIDVEKLVDDVTVTVKIYEDSSQTNFVLGFKATNLSPTELRGNAGIDAYVRRDTSLEGDELLITDDILEL